MSTAWIDYKKAFDSVPHSWILKCLQMYKIHPVLIMFIEESMSQWKTNMTLVHKEGVLETGPIRIKRGIFQGDSLSPLLFTMSLKTSQPRTPKDRIWIPTGWTDQYQPPVLCRWPEVVWKQWQTTNWANQYSEKCIRWHQDGNLDWTSVQRHHSRDARKFQLRESHWMTTKWYKTWSKLKHASTCKRRRKKGSNTTKWRSISGKSIREESS